MSEEKAMIDKVRDYISKCPYLKEYAELNVNYLQDKVNTYSVNESAGYDTTIKKYLIGSERQFLFTFDSKLIWNEDNQNNIDNSKFFENFKKWIEENNQKHIYPDIEGIYEIGATTDGYIFATTTNEAIYRIQCYLKYSKFN